MTTYKYKDINTSVDKDKTTIEDNGTTFYTEDKGTVALRLFINWRGQPFDLDNTTMKPTLDLLHSDGSIWRNEPLEVVSLESGLVQYKIPNNVIAHAGNVRAKLFLKNDNESVHVANFEFIIKDSGVEGAVTKEISVNLVDDAVRRIVKENAIEILGDDFEERLNTDVINHLDSNPKMFKGEKGDDGESLKYAELSTTEKEDLKSNITNQAVTDFVIEDESISEDKLMDNTIGIEKVNFIKSSRNLLNKNDVIVGKNLDTNTGELIPSSTASVFNKWFDVTPGDAYYSGGLYARAFYDTNKQFISGVTGNGSFTIPDNTKFARFSTTVLENAQLNRGTEAKPYDEYFDPYLDEDIGVKGLSNNSVGTLQIKNNSVTVDKVDFINRSNNLIDKNKISKGYAFSSDGSINENSRHAISDYVPIIPNQTYTVSSNSSRVNFYDEKKEYIGQFFSSDFTETFTAPPNAHYLRTNITISRYEDAMLNEGTEILPYEDWHEPYLEGITAGNNIDSEKLTEEIIKKIKEEENTIVKLPKNLIDKNSLIQGKSLNSKGEISENSMFYITDYIPIKENETYTASSGPQNRVIFYDESKNYIDYGYNPEDTITFTTPEKTAYVRLNVYKTFKDTPMLNEGTELLPYEDWHEPVVEEVTDGNNIDSEKLTEEIIKKIKEEETNRKTFTLDTSLNLNYTPETIQGCSDDDPLPMGKIQYTDMYDMYDELCNKYPNYVSRKVEGKDILEDEIISYTFKPEEQSFTRNSEEVEKTFKRFKFFIVSSTHGNERTSIWVLYNLMKLICEKWQTNESLEFLRWNVEFVICPIISPGGYRKFTRINANGVDLNRNFDADWENGSSDKSDTTYRGDAPMSEPEAIVCDNIIKRENPNFVIDFHNFHAQSTPTGFNWIIGYSDKVNDIADLVLSKMARKWKKQYPDLPQDVVGFGYGSPGIQVGSLTNYAQKKYGIPSSLFEVCWKMDAKTDSIKRDSFISTIGVDSFSNFLLQIANNANEL